MFHFSPRRVFLMAAAMLLAPTFVAAQAVEAWPDKPVKLIVPFPPGGPTDTVARIISTGLQTLWKQPVVVDYKPGAGTTLGTNLVAKSTADGYTLGMAITALTINPSLQPNLPYDTKKDLVGVSQVAQAHFGLFAHPSQPFNNMQELIAYAKKNPDKLNFGSSGNGSAPHLAGILFNSVTGTDMLHIPFKGGAPAVQSLIAGDTQVMFGTSPVVLPQVRGGRVRPLAITTQERSEAIPNIMGMKEAGLADYNISFSFGLYAPMKTPPEDVKKIFDAAVKVLKRQDIRDKLATQGMDPLPNNSPNEFRLQNQREAPLWSKLIEASGAKVD